MAKAKTIVKRTVMIAAAFGFAIALPVFAQDNPSASESMHQAGEAAKQAGSDTWTATKDVGHGTATAVRDTKITAKVKSSLHSAGISKDSDIHVTTTAGMVKLAGSVPSSETAERAVQLARQTEGVKGVTNDLTVAGARMAN